MGLAVGHSLQSVFAKATNIKRRGGKKHTIRSELSDLEHEEDKSKYLFCDSSWLLPSSTALIGEYLQCTKLLFILFCGCQSPRLLLNAGRRGGCCSLDAQICCWHNTLPERHATWFTPAKCHGNCEDLYQWESADEVTRLSDLTDLIRAQVLLWSRAGRPISLECPTSGGSERAFHPETSEGGGCWNRLVIFIHVY